MTDSSEYYHNYAFVSYKKAKLWSYYRYGFLVISMAFLLLSVKVSGYILYITSLVALVTFFLAWIINERRKAIKRLADDFYRQAILLSSYNNNNNTFKLSHLIAKIDKITQAVDPNHNESVSNATIIDDIEKQRDKLVNLIHENCYWNHHQYKELSYIYAGIAALFLFLLIMVIFLTLPFSYLDPDFIIPRMGFTALSFTIVYEIMEHTIKLNRSSKEMLEIDNELSRTMPLSEDRILEIYNNYITTKESTPDIPERLYRKNEDKLNAGWSIRRHRG